MFISKKHNTHESNENKKNTCSVNIKLLISIKTINWEGASIIKNELKVKKLYASLFQ